MDTLPLRHMLNIFNTTLPSVHHQNTPIKPTIHSRETFQSNPICSYRAWRRKEIVDLQVHGKNDGNLLSSAREVSSLYTSSALLVTCLVCPLSKVTYQFSTNRILLHCIILSNSSRYLRQPDRKRSVFS
jgi:hypothetical protein